MNWKQILDDPKIKDIIISAKAAREQANPDLGLNVFMLTSDYYYRETYHSDIIKEFLDTEGSHRDGNLYLTIFIQMLNNHGVVINNSYYTSSEVKREIKKLTS